MQADVVLVNPGSRAAVYQGLGAEFSAIEPPSMAAMFATYLRSYGHSVAIVDAPALALSPLQTAEAVAQYEPRLVVLVVYGFQPSASTQNMESARHIAHWLRKTARGATVMITGTHPAALPERTLKEEPVDVVCAGEGPDAIRQVIERLKAGLIFPGIVKGENLSEAQMAERMTGAAWDLLPMEHYRAHNWHCFEHIGERQPYASLHTTLGCPYRCAFCCINAPFGGSGYRMWSPESVAREIDILYYGHGVRNIKFVDEMFVLNRAHVQGVCDKLIESGYADQLNIWAYARVDTVKDEYLDKLRAAGFRWLALGIESASKHVRDGQDKGRFGNEEILKTVRKVQAAGINVIGNYIFGLPDDTHRSMRQTLDLALEANCEFANFYSAMAYPGSKLYTLAIEKGWRLPANWIGYSQHSYETTPLATETLSGAEVLAFRDRAFQEYFRNAGYHAMIARKFGRPVVEHIERMVEAPLPRKILGDVCAGR
jgi:radical SAM superfamily enzyme YgiQ (UPF0313 family)